MVSIVRKYSHFFSLREIAAKKLLGMKDEPLFAEHLDKTIIANDMGRYFVRKVENIRNEIDATPSVSLIAISYLLTNL